MSSTKIGRSVIFSICILFADGIGMQSAYGQVTDAAFANCVMISGGYTVDVIMLGTDEDCDDVQLAIHYSNVVLIL